MTCSDYLGTNLEKMREKVAKKELVLQENKRLSHFVRDKHRYFG